jgi:PAS domain S-box-containing protein
MKLKTKIQLGSAFLFLLALLLGGLGIWYLNRLAQASAEILKDNYRTLEYTQNMLQAIDQTGSPQLAQAQFAQALRAQQANLTEPGEAALTEQLREAFAALQATDAQAQPELLARHQATLRRLLYQLAELNMAAIVRKNTVAEQTAKNATMYLALVGTFCFLLALSFVSYFPGYIANPLARLTQGIWAIANRQYEARLPFQNSDEFGELAKAFNRMAAKLDEYEHSNLAKVLFEKKRIDTIINNLNDPIVGLDDQRRILFANQAAGEVLGLAGPDLIGKPSQEVALHNDLMRHLVRDLFVAPPASPGPDQEPLKIFANGKESYFNREVVEVVTDQNEQAQLVGYVILLKNITIYKELDAAKTNFIATISHELKTPIASIKMSLKLLGDGRIGPLNPEQQQLLAHVGDDSERLLKITGELLDMTQVETGNIRLNQRATAAADMVAHAQGALQVQAEQKQIKLVAQVAPGLPPVLADPDKTTWVLINLLSNAVRHSPEQSTILIEALPWTPDGHDDLGLALAVPFRVVPPAQLVAARYVVLSIKDAGKGIDPRYLPRLFDRYFQVPDNTSKTGTGLGLAISKEFIEAQGGSIWVDSELGGGSRFSLMLPAGV